MEQEAGLNAWCCTPLTRGTPLPGYNAQKVLR